jgi:hypothetical protein
VRSLSWTHWRHLMRVENPDARNDYIREAAEQGWNIATLAFERLLSTTIHQAIQLHAQPRTRLMSSRIHTCLNFWACPTTPSRSNNSWNQRWFCACAIS